MLLTKEEKDMIKAVIVAAIVVGGAKVAKMFFKPGTRPKDGH